MREVVCKQVRDRAGGRCGPCCCLPSLLLLLLLALAAAAAAAAASTAAAAAHGGWATRYRGREQQAGGKQGVCAWRVRLRQPLLPVWCPITSSKSVLFSLILT